MYTGPIQRKISDETDFSLIQVFSYAVFIDLAQNLQAHGLSYRKQWKSILGGFCNTKDTAGKSLKK